MSTNVKLFLQSKSGLIKKAVNYGAGSGYTDTVPTKAIVKPYEPDPTAEALNWAKSIIKEANPMDMHRAGLDWMYGIHDPDFLDKVNKFKAQKNWQSLIPTSKVSRLKSDNTYAYMPIPGSMFGVATPYDVVNWPILTNANGRPYPMLDQMRAFILYANKNEGYWYGKDYYTAKDDAFKQNFRKFITPLLDIMAGGGAITPILGKEEVSLALRNAYPWLKDNVVDLGLPRSFEPSLSENITTPADQIAKYLVLYGIVKTPEEGLQLLQGDPDYVDKYDTGEKFAEIYGRRQKALDDWGFNLGNKFNNPELPYHKLMLDYIKTTKPFADFQSELQRYNTSIPEDKLLDEYIGYRNLVDNVNGTIDPDLLFSGIQGGYKDNGLYFLGLIDNVDPGVFKLDKLSFIPTVLDNIAYNQTIGKPLLGVPALLNDLAKESSLLDQARKNLFASKTILAAHKYFDSNYGDAYTKAMGIETDDGITPGLQWAADNPSSLYTVGKTLNAYTPFSLWFDLPQPKVPLKNIYMAQGANLVGGYPVYQTSKGVENLYNQYGNTAISRFERGLTGGALGIYSATNLVPGYAVPAGFSGLLAGLGSTAGNAMTGVYANRNAVKLADVLGIHNNKETAYNGFRLLNPQDSNGLHGRDFMTNHYLANNALDIGSTILTGRGVSNMGKTMMGIAKQPGTWNSWKLLIWPEGKLNKFFTAGFGFQSPYWEKQIPNLSRTGKLYVDLPLNMAANPDILRHSIISPFTAAPATPLNKIRLADPYLAFLLDRYSAENDPTQNIKRNNQDTLDIDPLYIQRKLHEKNPQSLQDLYPTFDNQMIHTPGGSPGKRSINDTTIKTKLVYNNDSDLNKYASMDNKYSVKEIKELISLYKQAGQEQTLLQPAPAPSNQVLGDMTVLSGLQNTGPSPQKRYAQSTLDLNKSRQALNRFSVQFELWKFKNNMQQSALFSKQADWIDDIGNGIQAVKKGWNTLGNRTSDAFHAVKDFGSDVADGASKAWDVASTVGNVGLQAGKYVWNNADRIKNVVEAYNNGTPDQKNLIIAKVLAAGEQKARSLANAADLVGATGVAAALRLPGKVVNGLNSGVAAAQNAEKITLQAQRILDPVMGGVQKLLDMYNTGKEFLGKDSLGFGISNAKLLAAIPLLYGGYRLTKGLFGGDSEEEEERKHRRKMRLLEEQAARSRMYAK